MSAAPGSPAPPIAPWRWGVVWLLFLATMLAYLDRLALNNTQRYLLPEFEPDPAKRNPVYADIQFAFGVSFALFQVAAGFLIDRFSLRYLYLGAILLWSVAGVLTGFVPAGAIGMMIVCRVVLGVGEAFNWPCAVACTRRIIPRESRGLANGIFHSGASIGAVATPLLVLALVNRAAKFGLFFVVGAAAMGGFAIFFSLAQDVVPRHTAKVLGVCGCASWLAISGVTKLAGSLAGPGKYAELFLAVGCVPLAAAAAGWLWPRPAQGNSSSPAT